MALSNVGNNVTFAPSTGPSDAHCTFVSKLTSMVTSPNTVGGVTLSTDAAFVAGPLNKAYSTLSAAPNTSFLGLVGALTANVPDASGYPVAGQHCVFTASGALNTFLPAATVSSDVNGVCATTMTSLSLGDKTVTVASSNGLSKSMMMHFLAGSAAADPVSTT